ncbi:protein TESPA1 [Discoglossus pictus]
MDYQYVVSPSSSDRRAAWTQPHRHNAINEDDAATIPEFANEELIDAFLEETSSKEMIHRWLGGCRASIDSTSEDLPQAHMKGICSTGNSFEDDLTLGADAMQLSDHCESSIRVVLDHQRLKNLHMGNSMTSDSTAKTSSSVSEILSMCEENAEDILYNLGFAREDPSATSKIPARFFFLPSKAEGIDFRVFLESQVKRMEREDSSYTPKSHNILADVANAVCCLYSHVTREPVEFVSTTPRRCTYADMFHMKMFSLKEDQYVTPVERLRNTISKMCLYVPSKNRN